VPGNGLAREMETLAGRSDDGYDTLFAHTKEAATGDPLYRIKNWFAIPTTPPILVLDTRGDRELKPPSQPTRYATVWASRDDEILSEEQWSWFEAKVKDAGQVVVASSVPLLQFDAIDQAFSLLARPIGELMDLERASQDRADLIENMRRTIDADTWSAFPKSWARAMQMFDGRGPVLWLSGDVHFSYVRDGRVERRSGRMIRNMERKDYRLVHLGSSGFRHQMSEKDREVLDRLTLDKPVTLEIPSIEPAVLLDILPAQEVEVLNAESIRVFREGGHLGSEWLPDEPRERRHAARLGGTFMA